MKSTSTFLLLFGFISLTNGVYVFVCASVLQFIFVQFFLFHFELNYDYGFWKLIYSSCLWFILMHSNTNTLRRIGLHTDFRWRKMLSNTVKWSKVKTYWSMWPLFTNKRNESIELLCVFFSYSCPERYENAPDTGCQYRGKLYAVGDKIKEQFLPKRCDEECTCEYWKDER